MGLDNGITVKKDCVKNQVAQKLLDKYQDKYTPNYYEIAYWRKCWNVRRALINILDCEGSTPNDYEYPITSVDQVNQIIEYLKSLNKKTWCAEDSWAGSIWSWDEIKDCVKEQIKALRTLKFAMILDKNIEGYFYDSY